MSVFIAAKYAECIQLLTDGAAYTPDGTLVRVMDKCWYSRTLPLAITGRGHASMVKKIALLAVKLADEKGDMGEVLRFLDVIATKLREWRSMISEREAHCEIMVAYYHETEGFVQKVIWTHPLNGAAPFQWVNMEGWIIGSPEIPRQSEVALMAAQIHPNDPNFLPVFGARIVDLMREDLTKQVDLHPETAWLGGSAVGGHVRLTTVTIKGVKSTILKTYNDVLGEPINPYRDHGNVTPIGNRKKRRAMKAAGASGGTGTRYHE